MGLPGTTRRSPWRRCQPPEWADEGFRELPGEVGLGEAMYPKQTMKGHRTQSAGLEGLVGAWAGASVQVGLVKVGCRDGALGTTGTCLQGR